MNPETLVNNIMGGKMVVKNLNQLAGRCARKAASLFISLLIVLPAYGSDIYTFVGTGISSPTQSGLNAAALAYFSTIILPNGNKYTAFAFGTQIDSTHWNYCSYTSQWFNGCGGTASLNTCSVDPITVSTDPVANLYENGTYNSTDKPDLAHLTPATQTGLACIQQKMAGMNCYMTPKPTSGYRPATYQKHILEVYDKWQLLMNNDTSECADTKKAVYAEWLIHKPFARRPGVTSNHSQLDAQGNPAGNAVDISLVPDNSLNSADAIARQCNMYRPLINMPNPKDNDPVHYQPK